MPPQRPIQTRPIICKFYPEDREHIWDNKTALKGSNFFIAEDFPFDVEQSRKILFPIFLKARSLSVFKGKVSLRADRLYIGDKMYTAADLSALPPALNPGTLSARQDDNVYVFAGVSNPLSMSFPCTFKDAGITFNTVDQFVQYHRALEVSDDVNATRVLSSKYAGEQRRLGNGIKSTIPGWDDKELKLMEKATELKFRQNPNLVKCLVETENRKIREARGNDMKFGIGLKLKDSATVSADNWAGRNASGNILMELRNKLK